MECVEFMFKTVKTGLISNVATYFCDAKVRVRQEQMKVLGDVATMFRNLFLEKC